MTTNIKLKESAVALRKKGLTYSEILKKIPVAKSTLSLWLRDVGLSKSQKQRLTEKRLQAARRGADKKREIRIQKTKEIEESAAKDLGKLNKREIWLMGTMLYWAEGHKEKKYRSSVMVDFANSDPKMIIFFLKWLTDILKIEKDKIVFGLYIHENKKNEIDDVKKFWSGTTGFSIEKFKYVYFKKHKPKTKRKNTGEDYYGMLRVRVSKSTDLNRKIMGWVKEVCRQHSNII